MLFGLPGSIIPEICSFKDCADGTYLAEVHLDIDQSHFVTIKTPKQMYASLWNKTSKIYSEWISADLP
jgi:hypothetical protein